jgi:sulfofructose kinase
MGDFARESLIAEGVDVTGAVVDPALQNQIAVIFVEDGTGERTITYTRVPGLEVRPGEIDRAAVCSGKILLVDAHQLPATTQAAAWAREAGIPVVVDAERALPGVEALLEQCDFVLCDARFPEDFTGEADPKRALRAIARYGRLVAMTLGTEGSLAYAGGRYIRTPAYPVDAVDTTGAGDVFHAGFVAGLLLGLDAEGCLRFANATAALKCRALGGRAGLPTRDEVWARIDADR